MEQNCLFCENEFEELSIKRYNNWDLQLFRDDQYYLGRTAIVFQNRHVEDISEITATERAEVFDTIIPELQTALENTFDPDHYNYTSLGNDCSHVHIHVIPRYKNKREFNGKTFRDEYWGQTYSQAYDRVELESPAQKKLLELLRDALPK